jgi:putative spermidine/putrescine transport system permease protein
MMRRLAEHATASQIAGYWTVRVVSLLVCIFLVAPILVFIPLSFSAGIFFHYPIPDLSWRWYDDLFTSPFWLSSLFNSLIVGTATTVLATLLGVLAAFGLWRSRMPGKQILMTLLILPIIVPVIITAVATYYAFAPVHLTNSFLGLILAHTSIAVPFVLVTVLATLSSYDPDYLRAAASLGAPPLLAFRRVTLPLILPGVASGALFALAVSFDDVVIALFLAGPEQRTLPRQMFTASVDNFRLTITAAATVMTVISVCLLVAMRLLRRRTERLTAAKP